jgi:hypothetical protein
MTFDGSSFSVFFQDRQASSMEGWPDAGGTKTTMTQ